MENIGFGAANDALDIGCVLFGTETFLLFLKLSFLWNQINLNLHFIVTIYTLLIWENTFDQGVINDHVLFKFGT